MDIAIINQETRRSYQSCPNVLKKKLGLTYKKNAYNQLDVMTLYKLRPLPRGKASSHILAYTRKASYIDADSKFENFGLNEEGECVPLDWDYIFHKHRPEKLNQRGYFNKDHYEREKNIFANDANMQKVFSILSDIINPVAKSQRQQRRLKPVSIIAGLSDKKCVYQSKYSGNSHGMR